LTGGGNLANVALFWWSSIAPEVRGAMRHVQTIDEDRTYLTGLSMGGGGTQPA